MAQSEMIDVLISGAGPTGLMLAAELKRRDVTFRIIDKAPTRPTTSRALVLQARSLELLQKLGLAESLVARGRTTQHASVFVEKREIVQADFGDLAIDDTPFPFILFISQVETERALDTWLQKQGVLIERPIELLGYVQENDGITARIRNGGTEEQLRARYIVGCDGAHSAVRHSSGLKFEGAPYPQEFILADVHVEWDLPSDRFAIFMAREALMICFPLDEHGLYRLIASRARISESEQQSDPTLQELEEALALAAPGSVRLHDPVWLARFRLHHRGVEKYRTGRAFMAGDAAHIHSPAGGQGMNTGLQDAENLAWKLALALRGTNAAAGERLLDSYDAERRPIGRRLLKVTDRLFTLASSHRSGMPLLRNALASRVLPWAIRDRDRRRRAFRFISELGIHYEGSPIIAEQLDGADEAFRKAPRAGHRAPDASLVIDGRESSIFALMTGPEHHLLLFGGQSLPGEIAGLRVVPIARSGASVDSRGAVDTKGVAHARYGVNDEGACYLIRPDGYIAFRSFGSDPGPALAFFRELMG